MKPLPCFSCLVWIDFNFWLAFTFSIVTASPLVARGESILIPQPAVWPGDSCEELSRDLAGNIWAGSEDQGIFCFCSGAAVDTQWTQFITNSGLGEKNAYAIASDERGAVWVGHANHGVSVFNGQAWRNYDVLEGPIGERIYRIACCPTDGDVWMATSAGLTRYSVSKDTWRHYTRKNGLPSDQVQALAFDGRGNLFVGLACDGLAVGVAATDYQEWRALPTPVPTNHAAFGVGLPSRLINDLLVGRDGTLYAATVAGLARSTNRGATWLYTRGRNFPDKMKGRLGGPPPGWKVPGKAVLDALLPEEYITCLAEDEAGRIWLGFRQQGVMALAPTGKPLFRATKQKGGLPDDYVTAILPCLGSGPYVATYGGGVVKLEQGPDVKTLAVGRAQSGPFRPVIGVAAGSGLSQPPARRPAPFPSPARAPDLAAFNAMLQELALVRPAREKQQPTVVALEDDWKTQGQWVGRYGRYWVVLCANWSQAFKGYHVEMNDVWGAGWGVRYDARIGPNCDRGDSLRHWIHWLYTKDNRSLEMSPTYLHSRVLSNYTTWDVDRRQSEWDDHGEAYPMSKDGPHLYCSLEVPQGLFYLSLYDFNKDGHTGNNRFRDYYVSVRPHPGRLSLDTRGSNWFVLRSFFDLSEFDEKPELAHCRIKDFWGGVYKRFLVRGPTRLAIRVGRNNSFNTILAGVMLDLVEEMPPPYYQTPTGWFQAQSMRAVQRQEAVKAWSAKPENFHPATSEAEAAGRLLEELDGVLLRNDAWWAMNKRQFFAPLLRWYLRAGPKDGQGQPLATEALAACYYQMALYPQWEETRKSLGWVTTREIEKAQRWDGVMPSCAGKGHQIVTTYLATNSVRRGFPSPGAKAAKAP